MRFLRFIFRRIPESCFIWIEREIGYARLHYPVWELFPWSPDSVALNLEDCRQRAWAMREWKYTPQEQEQIERLFSPERISHGLPQRQK
jgi:hypothetical protein